MRFNPNWNESGVRMSVGLIDVGSNTIRLSVYALDGERFTRLFGKKVVAGLASYVDDAGRLSDEGVDRACEALSYLQGIACNLNLEETLAFATASLRNVENSAQALSAIEQRTGMTIDLVSGEEEALLGYSSFRHDCPAADGALVDIGGGSCEVVRFEAGEASFARSLPVGSLKLFEKCVSGIFPTEKERKAIRKQVKKAMKAAGLDDAEPAELLCGIGGTARAAARLVAGMEHLDGPAWDFTGEDLASLLALAETGNTRFRNLVLKNCPDRVHTIVPGLLVLQTVADCFEVERFHVSEYGVREGYLIERVIAPSAAPRAALRPNCAGGHGTAAVLKPTQASAHEPARDPVPLR